MDRVLRPLERLGDLEAMHETMHRAAEIVRKKVATEPEPFVQDRKRWWFGNARKRKWFFQAVRSGEIRTPYRRTHALANAWQTAVTRDGQALEGHITNDRPEAPWVQAKQAIGGAGPQARIHQKRWITEEAAVARTQGEVNTLFVADAERWLEAQK